MSTETQKRGRPRTLPTGHRVVALSLDPAELEWIDGLIAKLKASVAQGEVATRSSVIRSALRHMMKECQGRDLQELLARFQSAASERRPADLPIRLGDAAGAVGGQRWAPPAATKCRDPKFQGPGKEGNE